MLLPRIHHRRFPGEQELSSLSCWSLGQVQLALGTHCGLAAWRVPWLIAAYLSLLYRALPFSLSLTSHTHSPYRCTPAQLSTTRALILRSTHRTCAHLHTTLSDDSGCCDALHPTQRAPLSCRTHHRQSRPTQYNLPHLYHSHCNYLSLPHRSLANSPTQPHISLIHQHVFQARHQP